MTTESIRYFCTCSTHSLPVFIGVLLYLHCQVCSNYKLQPLLSSHLVLVLQVPTCLMLTTTCLCHHLVKYLQQRPRFFIFGFATTFLSFSNSDLYCSLMSYTLLLVSFSLV